MTSSLFGLAQSFLLKVDPERAHALTIQALGAGLHPRQRQADPVSLRVAAFGLDFPNPLGMAAGFDKDAEVVEALLAIGFGFAEAGTITPQPQPGNPRPRLFRLAADGAVINRLGFNSGGHRPALERLKKRRGGGIVGVNIGANRNSQDRVADYVAGVHAFAPVADYLTVNISSPNTPGLRELQAAGALDELLKRVVAARDEAAQAAAGRRPLLLKIAPDLSEQELEDIVRVATDRAIDGMIVSNTTVARPQLKQAQLAKEQGGLSGAPLFEPSTRMLARVYALTRGTPPLVGVGGISSAETAYAKVQAGASLLQLYTALIFKGPGLVGGIKQGLAERLRRAGYGSIGEAVGSEHEAWLEEAAE